MYIYTYIAYLLRASEVAHLDSTHGVAAVEMAAIDEPHWHA